MDRPTGAQYRSLMARIGVIGGGNIGATLAEAWRRAGHAIDIVDGIGKLWLTLVFRRGRPRRLAFRMLTDPDR